MKIFFLIYNSFITALALSFICFRIVWLEMRVNIGLLIPVFALLVFMIFLLSLRRKNFSKSLKMITLVNLVICAAVSLAVLGINSIGVVPASIIREALKMTHLKFYAVNTILIAVIAAGFSLIMLRKVDNK